jgi:hypothetical protein
MYVHAGYQRELRCGAGKRCSCASQIRRQIQIQKFLSTRVSSYCGFRCVQWKQETLNALRKFAPLAFVNSAFAEPRGSGALPNGYKSMSTLLKVIGIWFALNLAIPAFIIYQRSPRLRHRLFRFTLGGFSMPRERKLAHVLVEAAYHHH